MILTYPGVQVLDVTGPHEVFAGATTASAGRGPQYRLQVVAVDGGPVRSESGLSVLTTAIDDVGAVDTLIVPGGTGVIEACADPELVAAVGELAGRARRIATVCSGAFLAAAAGLLDGRRVATHWARARRLAATFPAVDVDDDAIYVRDGHVWSSAGVTAGIDLSLALVEEDHDAEVAQTVARWLVMYLRRPGGQTQFATPVWTDRAPPGPVRAAQELIESRPGGDLRLGVLAAEVGMSERHFVRRFTAEVGVTPGRYVARVRLEAARRELERTDDTLDVVAHRCGFGTAETLRRAVVGHLGVSPGAYRRQFAHHPTT